MPKKGIKKKSKCRVWEQERRNRICGAFTALIKILPSIPLNASRIITLQQAVTYIKELQGKNEELLENEKKYKDKTSKVEEQCLQLIQIIKEACLQVPPTKLHLLTLNEHMKIASPSAAHIHDITNKILPEEDEKSKKKAEESKNVDKEQIVTLVENSMAILPLDKSDIIDNNVNKESETKNVPKKCIKKPTPVKKKVIKKRNQKGNKVAGVNVNYLTNAKQKNNTINNVWLANGALNNSIMIGNTLLPIMPIASPVVMPTVPQPQAFFLLQRPTLSNSHTIIKESNVPLIKQIIPMHNQDKTIYKTYSSIYGMDVTKTTMVNKVPISAFSSSTLVRSTSTKKVRTVRVTGRSHRRFLKAIKSAKPSSPPSETNKENIAKIDNSAKTKTPDTFSANKKVPCEESAKSTTAPTNIDINNGVDLKNDKKKLDFTHHVAEVENIAMTNSKSETVDNIKKLQLNAQPVSNNRIDGIEKRIESNSDASTALENVNDSSKKMKIDNIEVLNSCSMSLEKNNPASCKESLKSSENKIIENKHEKYTGAIANEHVINQQHSISTNQCVPLDSECRLEKNKNSSGNNALGASEITEDLLASFGGPSEQNLPPSPLAASPLAASPTAAFLSAFPLVCSGPRPDTPSNDNLQTPHIYSLDNFSSFFPSKDIHINHNTSNNNTSNLYPDCHTKPSVHVPNSKCKESWLLNPNGNHNNYVKNLLSDISNNTKYAKNPECIRSSDKPTFSDAQPVYQSIKSVNTNGQFSMPDTMYNHNYDNSSILNNSKEHLKNTDFMNVKSHFNFDNNLSQNTAKSKISSIDNNTCVPIIPSYADNIPSTVACENSKLYNYNVPIVSTGDTSSCKKNQSNDNFMKLVLPGIIPECSASSKPIEIPFSFPTQSKSVFHNSSNIYTSCNTYNPFSSDFSSNSMNLSIPCANGLNPIRTKTSTTYIPEFNSSNIFYQSLWNDDNNQLEIDPSKIDYNKRLNLPMPNQSHGSTSDFQSDLRFPSTQSSKYFNPKQNNASDSKNFKTNNSKCSTKDIKFSGENKSKPEFLNQKGPVNWMTSDVGQHNNDIFYPNYKEIKHEQSSLLSSTSQPCIEPISNISGITSTLHCKKTDTFDQPTFTLPTGGHITQAVNEDNQYIWSPSKLAPFGDSSSLVPCSLPTLVGDLALGTVTDSKSHYQILSLEQDPSAKERKCINQKQPKELFVNKANCSQPVEINSSNGNGNFLSVSQLMERGKMDSSLMDNNNSSCKPCMEDNHKTPRVTDNQNRQFNNEGNKSYEMLNHSLSSTLFPSENYSVPQHVDNSLNSTKDSHYNNKVDSNIKSINKNNYSAESLLQNNGTNYQHMRKQKLSNAAPKNYGDNSNFPIAGNQYIPSNHSLQFDNFAQNQQFVSNTFPYSSSSVTMNSSFYSSANFISSSNNTTAPNYINNGFSVELGEFPNNLSDNIFYPSKVDSCKSKPEADVQDVPKYVYNPKISLSKDSNPKTKPDICNKKESNALIKRQKRHKNTQTNNYVIPDRCFNSLANQVNSPMGFDDTLFGYASSSQMHPYPSQSSLLPGIQPAVQHSQKFNFSVKPSASVNMSNSPNPAGTSLTNFNLSTIFPEINKRSSGTGYNDTQHPPSHHSKILPTGMYH